jgi:hypothetical protein
VVELSQKRLEREDLQTLEVLLNSCFSDGEVQEDVIRELQAEQLSELERYFFITAKKDRDVAKRSGYVDSQIAGSFLRIVTV